jgi:hypothetical protein
VLFSIKKLKKIVYILFLLEFLFASKCVFVLKKQKHKRLGKYLFFFQLQKQCLSQFLSFFFSGLSSMDKKYGFYDFKFNLYSIDHKKYSRDIMLFSNNVVSFCFNKFVFFDCFYNRSLFEVFSELLKFKIQLLFVLNSIDSIINRKIFGIYGFKNRYIN